MKHREQQLLAEPDQEQLISMPAVETDELPPPPLTPPLRAGSASLDAVAVTPPRRGPNIHKSGRFWRRSQFQVWNEGAPSTTRQAEILNTALIGSPVDAQGVIIGQDKLSGAIVAHDPMTAYESGRVTSPNVIVLGGVGFGKSSLLKTGYVMRPLMLRNRRAVVLDKKLQDGEGEYAEVTRQFGAEPFRFDPSDRTGTVFNLLDPVIVAGGGAAAQRQLLTAVAELAGGSELTEWHHKATSIAYRLLQRAVETGELGRPVPVIEDLTSRFWEVVNDPSISRWPTRVKDEVALAAASMEFRLQRLLEDDLAGMFDRETSPHVRLNPKLTTFDISALSEDGPAVSMVMLAANAWLMGTLTQYRGVRTNFLVEEGWHLLVGPGGKVIQSKSKLSRGLGLSLVAAIHHISDVPSDSPAIAMIKEAQTVHLLRQENDDDVADCVRYFNLEASNAAGLKVLNQGEHLLKVGSHREIHVQHIRTAREKELTNTDSALIIRTPISIPDDPPAPVLEKA